MALRFVIGDATRPIGDELKVVCHVCNDRRAWAAGFVLAVSRRWREPEMTYRVALGLRLGDVQFVNVKDPNIVVANMIAQHDFPTVANRVALDYTALATCLTKVRAYCKQHFASLHMPRIGCGIAGGDWKIVSTLIEAIMVDVPVTVYDPRRVPVAAS